MRRDFREKSEAPSLEFAPMKFRSSALDVMGDRSTIFPVALIPANRPGVIPKIPRNAMDNDPGARTLQNAQSG